jgi:hypothetical protein
MTTAARTTVPAVGLPAAVLFLLFAVAMAPTGAQQAPASRPPDRPIVDVSSQQGLTVAVYEGSDTIRRDGLETDSASSDGLFTGINPSIRLSTTRSRFPVSLDAGAAVRRYGSAGQFALLNGHGKSSVAMAGRHTGLKVTGIVTHSPYYDFLHLSDFTFANGAAIESTTDGAAQDRPVTSSTGFLDFSRQLSRRTRLLATYSLQYSHFGDAASDAQPLQDTITQQTSLQLARQVARYTALSVGYSLRSTTSPTAGGLPIRTHDVDFGFGRNQQLRLARRTTLEMTTGSSIVEVPNGHRLYLIGAAALNHNVSRTWTARVSGRRSVDYFEGLTVPAVVDLVSGTLGGSIGSRLEVGGSTGFSRGVIGVGRTNTPYHLYSGSVQLRASVTRQLAVFAEWTGYKHFFEEGAGGPGTFDRVMDRHGLRLGVLMNVPLANSSGSQRGAR